MFFVSEVEKQIGEELIASPKKLSGGDINDVYSIETAKNKYVVKINLKTQFPKMLEKEASALTYLNKNSPLNYPSPIYQFEETSNQYLILNYVQKGQNSQAGQQKLGELLAEQHKHSHSEFGWEESNYIGSLFQPNKFHKTWSDFYANERLLYQTKLAFDKGLVEKELIKKMENLCKELPAIFPNESPALLHGDLWGGNYFIDNIGNPFVYDPAVYFGHREMDLGMTRLFGGFDADFYTAYNTAFPLEKKWQHRIPITQLYPNLVHLNLFGRGYLAVVEMVLEKF